MQIRRPFCLFSLIFVLLVTGCVYGRENAGGKSSDTAPAERNALGRLLSGDETPESGEPDDGEQIVLTGTVTHKEYRMMYGEKIPVLYLKCGRDKSDRQIMCYLINGGDGGDLPRIGENIKVSGKVSLFREASNPGEFDLKEYYQILNVSYKLNRTEILERSESFFRLKEKLFQIKCRCCGVLESIYPQREASVLKAILLGDKNGLEEEIKELYQLNGLIHILSISGLHISLLGVAVSGMLKKCRMPVWLRAPIAAGIMWCYGTMTGMGVSTWRAIFMFTLHLAAELLGRTYDMLTAMSFTAVLLLTGQPLLVKHSGFLLSFGAVVGIGTVLPWWREVLGQFIGPDGRMGGGGIRKKLTKTVMEGIALGTGIAVTTLPVLFYFYYKYSVYSLLLNLYVIPLMSVVFAAGMVSMAVGFLAPWAGILLGTPDRVILWLYEISCQGALRLPGAVKIAGQPKMWQIVFYYVVLFFLILRHDMAQERVSMPELPAVSQCLLLLGALWLLLVRPCSGFSVFFLDVGQGDCIVMQNENGNCYMVDGGSTSKSRVGEYQILPFLESEGIEELKAVFLTHPDEDHISGVVELLEQSDYGVKIDSLILPDVSEKMKAEELSELRELARRFDIPVLYIGRGDGVQDKNLKLSCLGPEKGFLTDEVNEISTVLYVEYGEFRMLLTGDVTGKAERELVAELEGRDALTVLKVAHHGSGYSTPREFLEMTNPVYAIISVGEDNRYGHPHRELLERLREQGCRIYQTKDSGAVTVRARGGRIRVEEFLR